MTETASFSEPRPLGQSVAQAPSVLLPGFDVLRILAALGVIFSHSLLLAQGTALNEPVRMVTGHILGIYGVFVFFILSGYLVSDSALRSSNLTEFAMKRVRRILPAFVAATVVGTLIVAPFFADNGARAFLANPETWKMLLRVLTLQEGGLYFTDLSFYAPALEGQEKYTGIVNGVLWTIRIEIACYAMVGLLFACGLLRPTVVMGIAAATVLFAFKYELHVTQFLGEASFVLPCFMAGMVLRLTAHGHRAQGNWAAFSGAGLVLAMVYLPQWSALSLFLFPILAAYPLLWLGQKGLGRGWVSKQDWADPSYGIYIWGWTVQQILLGLMGTAIGIAPYLILCLISTLGLGYLSWFLIEEPFLRRKSRAEPYLVGTGTSPR